MLRRAIDITVSAIALVLLSPLLIAVALLVAVSSPGPILHRAQRAGRDGVAFALLKFRSMRVGAPGDRVTRAADPRITAVGRFLRKWKLDELPQLINVLRGEMSLVGPRPEDPAYVALYSPEERRILAFRPGLTSPASIAYRHEEKLLAGEDWERQYVDVVMREKLRIDLEYMTRRTILSDIGVLLRTMLALFR